MLYIYKIHESVCLFVCILLFFMGCQTQEPTPSISNYNGKDQTLNVLKYLKVNVDTYKDVAPHLPNPTDWINGEKSEGYTDAFKKWTQEYSEEFKAFANSREIYEQGFAWESLGYENPYDREPFFSPFSQAAQVLSPERLKEIAPNFPSEDLAKDKEEYERLISNWQNEHMQEYEDWLNAPEIMAIKPEGSREIADLGIQPELPEFMNYPDIDKDYPLQGEEEDDNIYALRLQHWYYVYHPEKYEEEYGKFPVLPEDFDLDKYIEQYPKDNITDYAN